MQDRVAARLMMMMMLLSWSREDKLAAWRVPVVEAHWVGHLGRVPCHKAPATEWARRQRWRGTHVVRCTCSWQAYLQLVGKRQLRRFDLLGYSIKFYGLAVLLWPGKGYLSIAFVINYKNPAEEK